MRLDKLHLGRIMELYLKDRRGPQEYRERQAMDNGQSLRETPLTLLYGVHGEWQSDYWLA